MIDSFALVLGTQEKELCAKNYYRLYVQSGHCTANSLFSLLKLSRQWTKKNNDMIHEVIFKCEVCRVYRRHSFKPAVGLPPSYRFSECVPMDLHQVTVSNYVADHLSGLHVARKIFVQSESLSRNKRALKSNIRAGESHFASQDFVYYKRDNNR